MYSTGWLLNSIPLESVNIQTMMSKNRNEGIDPDDVQTRGELQLYLSQSLSSEYIAVVGEGTFRQTSTFVKSYIVEAHTADDERLSAEVRRVFPKVVRRSDKTLFLLKDKAGEAYFADTSDSRFIIIHSIAGASRTDKAIEKLTEGEVPGFDRTWMATEFLLSVRRGKMIGFNFRHERFVRGLRRPEPPLMPQIPGSTEILAERPRQRNSRFRMLVSEDFTAEQDYETIRDSNVARGRKALEHIHFVTTEAGGDGRFISSGVYSNGKVIGSGTSIGAHFLTVDRILGTYSDLLEDIESVAVGWVPSGGGLVHHGEPFLITFPQDAPIADLQAFAGSVFRPSRPFRLLGIPHSSNERRVNIEAIDLHTGHPLSAELTREWMRVYLPKGTCGNVLARMFVNLQHAYHSDVKVGTGSGELVFDRGAEA